MIMRNMRIWPTSSSKDKLFPIPTNSHSPRLLLLLLWWALTNSRDPQIGDYFIVGENEKWNISFFAGELLQTPVIYFSNVNSVQHYSISSAPVFRCCKLLNLQTLKVDKTGKKVFSYHGGYFFGNMLNQNEIYLPSRVQSKHICQVTLWMCMWIEDINLNPQCKESCTQNRATLM